jgi:replicative superfamily II helicase
LDILQIFGRAGRPQFDNVGEAFIICEYKKLNHFIVLITNQLPIESHFKNNISAFKLLEILFLK